MKAKMFSREAMEKWHHIETNFVSSLGSIELAREKQLITDQEYTELLKKNSLRLIERLKSFKMMYQLVCFFFAALFVQLQVSGEDMDLRRPGRTTRSARSARARTGRKGRRDEDISDLF